MSVKSDCGVAHGRALPLFHCVLLAAALLWCGSAFAAGSDETAEAAFDFRSYCAPCHGLDARGDGPVAQVLKTRPSDLTKLAGKYGGALPFEVVYKSIEGVDMPNAHGSSEMPVWGLWFANQAVGERVLDKDAKPTEERVRERIGALVRYLETIQE